MASSGLTHHAKATHKQRKVGRHFRWCGTTHSMTKYRLRHGIAADAKRKG